MVAYTLILMHVTVSLAYLQPLLKVISFTSFTLLAADFIVGLQTIQGPAPTLLFHLFLAIILIVSPTFTLGITMGQSPWTAHRPEAIQPWQWAGLLHLSKSQPVLEPISQVFGSYLLCGTVKRTFGCSKCKFMSHWFLTWQQQQVVQYLGFRM